MLRFTIPAFVLFGVVLATGCSQTTQQDTAPGTQHDSAPGTQHDSAAGAQYDSAAGKFVAEFPGEPNERSQEMQTPLGTMTAHIVLCESRTGAYMVMFADYAQSHVQSTGADQLLDTACDGAVANINGRVISKTPISIGDHPGRELRVSATLQGRPIEARNRIYLVGNRLYQIIVTAAPGNTQDSTANRFVDSFKLR